MICGRRPKYSSPKSRRGLLFVLAISGAVPLGMASAAEVSYRYHCPRSNATFVTDADRMTLLSGPYGAFPRTDADIDKPEEAARRSAQTKDCSNAEFSCVHIEPGAGLAGFYVFAPKHLELGRIYHFNGMDAVSAVSTATTPSQTLGQLTLWQRIDGRELPITLTLKSGVGAVYVDGLQWWSPYTVGRPVDTCLLVSSKGLFADVTVTVPRGAAKPVMQ